MAKRYIESKIRKIINCAECPKLSEHFDDYYCHFLKRLVSPDELYNIPSFCPLDDWNNDDEGILCIDSRESLETKQYFIDKASIDPNLTVQVCKLETGDYQNRVMVLESKSIDDFISSFTEKIQRKDGTYYHRLESQINRMLDMDKPVRTLLIHGDLQNAHSNIHPNSVHGQIASIISKGITVLKIPDHEDYRDMIYRIHNKSLKYNTLTEKVISKEVMRSVMERDNI